MASYPLSSSLEQRQWETVRFRKPKCGESQRSRQGEHLSREAFPKLALEGYSSGKRKTYRIFTDKDVQKILHYKSLVQINIQRLNTLRSTTGKKCVLLLVTEQFIEVPSHFYFFLQCPLLFIQAKSHTLSDFFCLGPMQMILSVIKCACLFFVKHNKIIKER